MRSSIRLLHAAARRVLLCVLAATTPCLAVGADEPIDEFRSLLAQVKDVLRQENQALALRLLEEASDKLDELEKRPMIEEEALRWDFAQVNLNRADSMSNATQRAYFANEAIQRWREYVRWRGSLSSNEIEILEGNPQSDRIQVAVRLMGNAYMLRENIGDYSIRGLFEEYRDLRATFMSSKSIDLWMNWLHRCPDWKKAENPSIDALARRFEETENACKDDWSDFHDYLETWLEEQKLTKAKKRRYGRRLESLANVLGY